MSKVIAEEDSRSKFWLVDLGGARRYPFPARAAAELFASDNNGKVIEPDEGSDET